MCVVGTIYTIFYRINVLKFKKYGLKNAEDSVHYLSIPSENSSVIDEKLENRIHSLRTVCELGRRARDLKNLNLRVCVHKKFQTHD